MTRTKMIVIVLAALSACSKKSGSSSGGEAKAIDVAPINALVPPPLKDKLVFEKRDIVLERGRHNTTYTLAAPKGWKQRMTAFGGLEPDRKDVGFFTKLDVGSNCDGSCEPKDWEKVADKVNFAPYTKGKVLKDDKTKGHRTMIAEDATDGTTHVIVAWWADGDRNYHQCSVTLDKEIKDATAAFEKACQTVNIDGDD